MKIYDDYTFRKLYFNFFLIEKYFESLCGSIFQLNVKCFYTHVSKADPVLETKTNLGEIGDLYNRVFCN